MVLLCALFVYSFVLSLFSISHFEQNERTRQDSKRLCWLKKKQTSDRVKGELTASTTTMVDVKGNIHSTARQVFHYFLCMSVCLCSAYIFPINWLCVFFLSVALKTLRARDSCLPFSPLPTRRGFWCGWWRRHSAVSSAKRRAYEKQTKAPEKQAYTYICCIFCTLHTHTQCYYYYY